MAKKLSFVASRHTGVRLFRWSALAFAGVMGGMVLGEMAAGTRPGSGTGGPASYSHLSANPDALVPQGEGAAPCTGCADSYGVAMRLRAHRDDRMSDEFRELGAVDNDPQMPVDADDDYRYGGSFPDPEPGTAAMSEDPHVVMPTGATAPASENDPPLAE